MTTERMLAKPPQPGSGLLGHRYFTTMADGQVRSECSTKHSALRSLSQGFGVAAWERVQMRTANWKTYWRRIG